MKAYKMIGAALLLLSASCGSSNEASDSTGASTESKKEVSAGKKLFINNCIQCHAVAQDKNGPALAGSMARWNNDTAKLVAYIKNSQAVIATDPYAEKLYKDWSNMVMPPFPNLSDGEIKDILEYIGSGAD